MPRPPDAPQQPQQPQQTAPWVLALEDLTVAASLMHRAHADVAGGPHRAALLDHLIAACCLDEADVVEWAEGRRLTVLALEEDAEPAPWIEADPAGHNLCCRCGFTATEYAVRTPSLCGLPWAAWIDCAACTGVVPLKHLGATKAAAVAAAWRQWDREN